MSQKIDAFKDFVREWRRNLREPRRPEMEISDTLWGRIEAVCFGLISILLWIWLFGSLLIKPSSARFDTPDVLIVVYILGALISVLAAMIGFPILLGLSRGIDWIIRGSDSGDVYDWIDMLLEFIIGLTTRPISWANAIIGNMSKLRRYRREMQSYIRSKIKADDIWADLGRPDAGDIFSGIDDIAMLERILRN